MEDLRCDSCYTHIGWMNYSGPRGWVYCDSCKEKEDEERDIDEVGE